jgi:hypothetical protein
MHNTDSPGGVAATSAPGLIYAAFVYLFNQPIEKWVSAATFFFVVLQMFFLLKDRMKKRRHRKGEE